MSVCEWVSETYADPGVFEGVCGSDSLGWINGQHLVDQVFGLWSHCVPLRGRELFEERCHRNIYNVPPTIYSVNMHLIPVLCLHMI